jgi:L-aspartate oxidase (EC 1.4.3.16)
MQMQGGINRNACVVAERLRAKQSMPLRPTTRGAGGAGICHCRIRRRYFTEVKIIATQFPVATRRHKIMRTFRLSIFLLERHSMNKQTCDFLVIGTGIAGLSFALHAARYGSVIIITKKQDTDSNTNHAQGGIACVLSPGDSAEAHVRDTLAAGAGLCKEEAVRILVEEGPERVKELLQWGVRFSRDKRSAAYKHLELGREGGHSHNRIVHAKDLTGREIEKRF